MKPGSRDKIGADGISTHMFSPTQMKAFYEEGNYEFRKELFEIFDLMLQKMYLMIANAEDLKLKLQN